MSENTNHDLVRLNRMDALWQHGVSTSIGQMHAIIKRRYGHDAARKWCIWLIGESGIGKNHVQEQVAQELGIEYLWFPCKGVSAEDIRGFPLPVRTLKSALHKDAYSGDVAGLVSLFQDYYHEEPAYTFQLLVYLRKAFQPGWKGIIHFDEFPQASKEVQEILYMLFYDRRLDDKYLSDGALVIASMNPPSVNEYMLNRISKAAQDRPSIFKLEATAAEWLAWARAHDIDERLIDFVTEYPGVFERNKGRALHRFSDIVKTFDDIDPNNIPFELTIEAHANIDIESATLFARYLKEIYAISGVALLRGDRKQFEKLEKMLKSESKAVYLYQIQQEMFMALKDHATYFKEIFEKYPGESEAPWNEIARHLIEYFKLLKNDSIDASIGFLKELTQSSCIELEEQFNIILKEKENIDLYKEILRCLSITIMRKPETAHAENEANASLETIVG